MAQNLKVNDEVKVIAGDHKGETATIVKIDREKHEAMLEGIGLIERHLKKSYYNPTGGKKTVHVGIDLSNLKLEKAGESVAKTSKKAADKGEKSKKDVKSEKKAKKGAK